MMQSTRVRSFGLVPLNAYDIPSLRVLKKVLVRANLQLVANGKSLSTLSLRASRPYAPSTLLSSSLRLTTLCPIRALASSSTNTLSLGSVSPSPQLLPENTFQLCVLGTVRWSVRNDEVCCLAFTSQLEAHGHKSFFIELASVHRRYIDFSTARPTPYNPCLAVVSS